VLLVRSFELAARGADLGSLFDLAAAAAPDCPVWLHLQDDAKNAPAVQRALTMFPGLAALQGTYRTQLASLPEHEAAQPFARPVDRALAREVARAVPKPLKFAYCNIELGPLDALWLAPGAPAPRRTLDNTPRPHECAAAIVLSSRAPVQKRVLELHAHVMTVPPPNDATALPALPGATQALLASLGKVRREQHHLIWGDSDPSSPAAIEPAAEALLANARIEPDQLPHVLVDDEWPQGDQEIGSVKHELGRSLPAYRYASTLSSQGIWIATRRTPMHNELAIKVERTPLRGDMSARLHLRGPRWRHSLPLPSKPDDEALRVWSPATMARLCENWAAAIASYESSVIPALETLYGPGLAWYSPGPW
jgi:hypothetical protein